MHHAFLLRRHRAVLPAWPRPSYGRPIELVGGDGRHVTDADGRRYLDFFPGTPVNLLGHGVREITEALERRLRTGMLHSSPAFLIGPQVELAERIAALSGIPDAKVHLTGSGPEAVDTALLMATRYRGRAGGDQVLALKNSDLRTAADRGLTPAEVVAPGPVAALLVEAIQGGGGFTTPPEGWLAALAGLLTPAGALLVADETQTGWGRTGKTFWGIRHEQVEPDLIAFAEGLGGGLAIGGLVGPADVVDALGAESPPGLGGNHLAATGALAVLDYLEKHHLQENAARVGALITDELVAGTADLPGVVTVRGRGLMIGIELTYPEDGSPARELAAAVHEECRVLGLLVGRGGPHANVLGIGAPMTLTEDEARDGTGRLLAALQGAVPS